MKKPNTPLKAGIRPILSILTPSVPSRWERVEQLSREIYHQASALDAERKVEHLVFSDNWNRRIGEKRDNLLGLARGQYIAYVDDDDNISPDYIQRMLSLAATGADVLTFRQNVLFEGKQGMVEFRLNHPDEAFKPGEITRRGPWHVCGWKRTLVEGCIFPHLDYGEDAAWSAQARRHVKTEAHWPHVLHGYLHDVAVSEAPAPL
jgi:glycosyltransferase involved in cell wall biosynthesis